MSRKNNNKVNKIMVRYGKQQPQSRNGVVEYRDVFVVLEGSKMAGIYRYRDDADAHAEVVGGKVILQQIKEETPGWVSTMLEAGREKARMQSGGGR